MVNATGALFFLLIIGGALYLTIRTVGRYIVRIFGNHFVTSDQLIVELIKAEFFTKHKRLSRYTNRWLSQYIRKASMLPGFKETLDRHNVKILDIEEAKIIGIRIGEHHNWLLYLNNFIGY